MNKNIKNMNKENCQNCKFWEKYKDPDWEDTRGNCRRNPPLQNIRMSEAEFPETLSDFWCGEFKKILNKR